MLEERFYRKFDAVRLPEEFCVEQDRGFPVRCCEKMLVLGSLTDNTWQNDVTSAWLKLSSVTDTVTFSLTKEGQATSYLFTTNSFVSSQEPYSKYCTIQWKDVLVSDGRGCYELNVDYNISGIIGSIVWGKYQLEQYSIDRALKTARIRVKFNLMQEVEGIDFTDSNVEDSVRFHGFIGHRQPNTEIDNLIYQNRELKTVTRENLYSYEITTDPYGDCLISRLTELYLLSENELYISDYNAHNHSYKILDVPVIVEESPEIDYLDQWQRKAILTCTVGDRIKNSRTYYKRLRE